MIADKFERGGWRLIRPYAEPPQGATRRMACSVDAPRAFDAIAELRKADARFDSLSRMRRTLLFSL
jgi:hypothetical protein